MKRGCLGSILGAIIIGAVIQIYFSLANEAALRIAKNECITKRQVDIVDNYLWSVAVSASKDRSFPNRMSYSFFIEYPKFHELDQDKFFRAVYRSYSPVLVKGKIVAYRRNAYVYPYSYGAFLMGGFQLPLYHCNLDTRNISEENMIISNFNQFGRD